jgi:hypothetical protein
MSLNVTFIKRGAIGMNYRRQIPNRRLHTKEVSLSESVTARITLLDRSIAGFREVDSLGSILRVRAAPFVELEKATIDGNFVTYVIDAPRLYAGHGRVSTRNMGDRIDVKAARASQVYVIYSGDPRFDKLTASYVEARLIDTAAELAIPLANGIRPFGFDGLTLSPDLEQLVQQAEVLLSVAGFLRFEEARLAQAGRPARVTATGDLHDLRVIEPEAMMIPADATCKRLNYRDLLAEGYQVGDRFHVLAGADYCYASKSGLSSHNQLRRQAIEAMDVLEPLPGAGDHARLRVGLDCKSAAIAAKILTGEHIGSRAWRAAPCPDVGVAV